MGKRELQYRSFSDLNRTIAKKLYKIPPDIDLVVGVPRSGLMAANILALHLHLPLADVNGFMKGEILSSGKRMDSISTPFASLKNILVIDDSLATGAAMRDVKNKLQGSYPDKTIHFGVVYLKPGSDVDIDFFFEECPMPRLFEWNMMNHGIIEKSCVDIDGVLCKDPTPEENDDGENYLNFLENAKPLLRANYTIGTLVTNRLEKYRPQTEAWLARNGITFEQLIMRDFASQQERRQAGDYGSFKGRVFADRGSARLFIESSYSQAKEIAIISGKPVYCVDKRQMLWPSELSVAKRKVRSLRERISRKLQKVVGFDPVKVNGVFRVSE